MERGQPGPRVCVSFFSLIFGLMVSEVVVL
jgi:hypothetical protein